MVEMTEIESKTKAFADARHVLETRVGRLTNLMAAVNRRLMPGIKSAVAACAEARENLAADIDDSRELFEKPKTQVFYGIKVGLVKGKGAIEFEDEAHVIKLIRSKLPEKEEFLIKTESSLIKKNLSDLEGSELKKIGVTVEGTGEYVFIKSTDSAVDKVVKALLKDSEKEAQQARKEAA